MNKNNITNYMIKDLEGDVNGLKSDVKLLMTNHLPHIQTKLVEVEGKIDILATRVTNAVAVNIVLMIAGVIGIVLLVK